MNKRCCSHMLLILNLSLIFFTVPAHAADPPMDTLVTVEWLSRHLDDPDLVVLDCTVNVVMDESGGMKSVSGRADYESGHIPGAAFADLMVDLSDADSPLKNALPTPEQFCAAMGALGVGDDTRVVLVRWDLHGLGRPGLVDAALGRFRPSRGSRWRIAGLERCGTTSCHRAS